MLQLHPGGELITNLDEEDRTYFDGHFTRIYDKMDDKVDEQDYRIDKANANLRMAKTEGKVSVVETDVASMKADIDWHKWAIRGLLAGTLVVGSVGGYAALG